MTEWKKVVLKQTEKIIKAVEVLQETSMQLVMIVNDENKLMGVITDGDIRRAILKGLSFDQSVTTIMNSSPITVGPETTNEAIVKLFKTNFVAKIPKVDTDGSIITLCSIDQFLGGAKKENPVIIMAGGLGSRLGELTSDTPKPLLKVGGKPILETILQNCIEQGFYDFYLSVNYKSEMIKEYFGDGSRWGVSIQYLEETKRLGTAGALKLMSVKKKDPIIVMNGDLLTKVDFRGLLDYHKEHESVGTMCVKEYDFQVPYGVIRVNEQQIKKIDEKPVQSLLINAGIYALEAEVIQEVPEDTYYDMTQLFNSIIDRGKKTFVFPIHEYWLDIGKIQDFERAQIDYGKQF